MVARDYAAYVRHSTGKEDPASVGGFPNPDVHPSIFEFKESVAVFESLEGSGARAQARCHQYRSLLEGSTPEERKKFGEAAREDIGVAIESFRSRDPQNFPPPLSNRLPNAEPVHGETHRTPPPSSSEVRVSPTPGREGGGSLGEGSPIFFGGESLEVKITVNGIDFHTLRLTNENFLTLDEVLWITKAGIGTIDRFHRELVDKLLEDLDPCPIDPDSIPALE